MEREIDENSILKHPSYRTRRILRVETKNIDIYGYYLKFEEEPTDDFNI